jgi:multisubunit Na+/H+ antiporter MnhF subunit
MNQWEVAAAVLAGALVPCLGVVARAQVTHGLVALELASALLTSTLMTLAEGLRRQPFIDLALIFALVSLIGALVFARMMERDL